MTDKQQEALLERAKIAKKWGDFFESGNKLTPEKKREMQADNERIKRICDEATREWLEKRKLNK